MHPALAHLAGVVRRDRTVAVEEVEQCFRNFRTIIPVHDFASERRSVDNVSVDGITLAKKLAQGAGLVHLSQAPDLQTRDGIRATYGIAFQPNKFNNCERHFFIREDILQTLLKEDRLSLVWAFWGERQVSYAHVESVKKTLPLIPMPISNIFIAIDIYSQ